MPRSRATMRRIARRTMVQSRRIRWAIKKDIQQWCHQYGLKFKIALRTNREWKTLMRRYYSLEELVEMPMSQSAAVASYVLLLDCQVSDICAVLLEQPTSNFFQKFAKHFQDDSPKVVEKKLILAAKKLKKELQQVFAKYDLNIGKPLSTFQFQDAEQTAFPLYRRTKVEVL